MYLRSFSTPPMTVIVHKQNEGKIVCEVAETGISASIFFKRNAFGYYEVKESLILALKATMKEYKDRQEASVKMMELGIRRMELGNMNELPPFKFRVGEIVRRGSGSTALFKVTDIYPDHGGKGVHRYYGRHMLGGYSGAYEDELSAATKRDLKAWDDCQP